MHNFQLTARPIDGIWHTSIFAYGMEYFFGSNGIQTCKPVRNLFIIHHYWCKLAKAYF